MLWLPSPWPRPSDASPCPSSSPPFSLSSSRGAPWPHLSPVPPTPFSPPDPHCQQPGGSTCFRREQITAFWNQDVGIMWAGVLPPTHLRVGTPRPVPSSVPCAAGQSTQLPAVQTPAPPWGARSRVYLSTGPCPPAPAEPRPVPASPPPPTPVSSQKGKPAASYCRPSCALRARSLHVVLSCVFLFPRRPS